MARLHTIRTSSSPETKPGAVPDPAAGVYQPDSEFNERVQKVLSLLRPVIQADGGDIELVGITPEKVVEIRLHGACVGCPSSSVTLQTGIERNLLEHVPGLKGVRAVD